MKRNREQVGVELAAEELATVSGAGGWFENNWLFGYTPECSRAMQTAYRDASMDALFKIPGGPDRADDAGVAAEDQVYANDPVCQ
jgi:hypothetical protein